MRYSRYAVPHALLVDVADTMDRYGRLQLTKRPRARVGAASRSTEPCSKRSCAPKKIAPMLGVAPR